MQQTAPSREGAATARLAAALHEPLRQFVFETHAWIKPRALTAALGVAAGDLNSPQVSEAAWRRATAHFVPPRRLDAALLARDLRGRLALLPRDEWWKLGLCVCVLPSCGQIQRSLDGHFRRAVRQLLEDEVIQALDEIAPGERPVFTAGPGAWRDLDGLAAGGVRAAMAQVCLWPEPVRQRVRLRFEPEEMQGPPSVRGLDMTWLEIACKALWPQHPWLWS